MMPLVVTKSRVHYRKGYHRTWLLTITVLDCWISVKRLCCYCKKKSVVDYALVSSDMFLLISDFSVLDFCELYSDVHCPIILKLNLTEAQETELGHFGSGDDDDCVEDADEKKKKRKKKKRKKKKKNLDTLEVMMMIVLRTLMKKINKNLQFITGKPVWCKTMEDEYYFCIR